MSNLPKVLFKNQEWEADYLLGQVEEALRFDWVITNEAPVYDHEHCVICWEIFETTDNSTKYRSTQKGTRKYYDQSSVITVEQYLFLDCECYERFIAKNGIEEIRQGMFNQ